VDTNCEVSIGSDICEREQDDHAVPFQDLAALEDPVAPVAGADDQPSPLEILPPTEQGEAEQEEVVRSTGLDNQPTGQNEMEEDKAPETPTNSVATQRSDRMFLLERKRSLSLSLDGSVASEMDGGEPSTVDQLRSALQAERKALGALYAELEEERSAAAIAANQTMAMINRLQEEKAAMQMEALQYQRMMEEQSEYDQEALQLLNELSPSGSGRSKSWRGSSSCAGRGCSATRTRSGGGWRASRPIMVAAPVAVALPCRPAARTAMGTPTTTASSPSLRTAVTFRARRTLLLAP